MPQRRAKRRRKQADNSVLSNSVHPLKDCFFADQAMNNYLIATKILSGFPFEDLKTLRLISKNWRRWANAEMLRRGRENSDRRDSPMKFMWNNVERKYKLMRSYKPVLTLHPHLNQNLGQNNIMDPNVALVDRDLMDLAAILSGGDLVDFPYFHFYFFGGDLQDGGALQFFENYGKNIQTLILEQVRPSKFVLGRLLAFQTPNVQKLSLSVDLWQCSWISHPIQGIQSSIGNLLDLNPDSLANLEILHFAPEMNHRNFKNFVAEEIVRKAGNLKVLGNFPVQDFSPEFWRVGHNQGQGQGKGQDPEFTKVHLLKEITISSVYREMCHDLQQLARVKPTLKILRISSSSIFDLRFKKEVTLSKLEKSDYLQAKAALESILRSSVNSLEVFQGGSLATIVNSGHKNDSDRESDKTMITFDNVHRVTLQLDVGPNQQFNPEVVQALFPRVTSLTLDFAPVEKKGPLKGYDYFAPIHVPKEGASSYSPPGSPEPIELTSVLELEFTDEIQVNCWKYFQRLFPNLRRLKSTSARNCFENLFASWPLLEWIDWLTWSDGKDLEGHRRQYKYHWRVVRGDCPKVIWTTQCLFSEMEIFSEKAHKWTEIEAFSLE